MTKPSRLVSEREFCRISGISRKYLRSCLENEGRCKELRHRLKWEPGPGRANLFRESQAILIRDVRNGSRKLPARTRVGIPAAARLSGLSIPYWREYLNKGVLPVLNEEADIAKSATGHKEVRVADVLRVKDESERLARLKGKRLSDRQAAPKAKVSAGTLSRWKRIGRVEVLDEKPDVIRGRWSPHQVARIGQAMDDMPDLATGIYTNGEGQWFTWRKANRAFPSLKGKLVHYRDRAPELRGRRTRNNDRDLGYAPGLGRGIHALHVFMRRSDGVPIHVEVLFEGDLQAVAAHLKAPRSGPTAELPEWVPLTEVARLIQPGRENALGWLYDGVQRYRWCPLLGCALRTDRRPLIDGRGNHRRRVWHIHRDDVEALLVALGLKPAAEVSRAAGKSGSADAAPLPSPKITRKKPAREYHRWWQDLRRNEGLSWGAIAKRHEARTGEVVSRYAVQKAVERLEAEDVGPSQV